MSAVAIACLMLGLSALALCSITWYRRFSFNESDSGSENNGGPRDCLALSALLSATSSAMIYVAFLLLWAYSSHSFNGRQPAGAVAIWVGLLSAVFGLIAAFALRGISRLLIMVSSAAVLFLWILAGAASVAV